MSRIAPSPVVELNRAVAVAMASGPAVGLELVEVLPFDPSLEGYHLLASVRGDLLEKRGRFDEARTEFEPATSPTRNARERELLLECAAACGPESMPSSPGAAGAAGDCGPDRIWLTDKGHNSVAWWWGRSGPVGELLSLHHRNRGWRSLGAAPVLSSRDTGGRGPSAVNDGLICLWHKEDSQLECVMKLFICRIT